MVGWINAWMNERQLMITQRTTNIVGHDECMHDRTIETLFDWVNDCIKD